MFVCLDAAEQQPNFSSIKTNPTLSSVCFHLCPHLGGFVVEEDGGI